MKRLRALAVGVLMWVLILAVQIELAIHGRRAKKALPVTLEPKVPEPARLLFGRFARCSRGRPGIILNFQALPWGWAWTGIGLDTGQLWASRRPTLMTLVDVQDLVRAKEMEAADHNQAITTCSRAAGHTGPCNGLPCS